VTTLLQTIQEEATSSAVPVSTVLRRAQVLGFRLQHEPLKEWTKKELDGYHHTDDLPSYRYIGLGQVPVKAEVFDRGTLARNVPLAPSDLDALGPTNADMVKKHLFETLFIRPISEYELLLATGNHEFPMPWTGDELRLVALIWPGLINAARMIPANAIASLIDQVRNRILTFSLEIEQQNPDAGEALPGAPPIPETTVSNIFHNSIVGDHAVISAGGLSSAVTVTHTQIDAAWPELSTNLAGLGVPEDELGALADALRADGDPGTELGPATRTWIGSLATKVATGGIALAGTDAINEIVQHLMHSLGLG
jgi:hypothetical protein